MAAQCVLYGGSLAGGVNWLCACRTCFCLAELAALGDEMADTDGSYLDEALSTPARPQGEDPKPEEETDPDRLEQQLGL